jgi:hypothetical protein
MCLGGAYLVYSKHFRESVRVDAEVIFAIGFFGPMNGIPFKTSPIIIILASKDT